MRRGQNPLLYYIVSNGGTQFSKSFDIGDWIISNGTGWYKIDNTDAVSAVAGSAVYCRE